MIQEYPGCILAVRANPSTLTREFREQFFISFGGAVKFFFVKYRNWNTVFFLV